MLKNAPCGPKHSCCMGDMNMVVALATSRSQQRIICTPYVQAATDEFVLPHNIGVALPTEPTQQPPVTFVTPALNGHVQAPGHYI